MATNKTSCGAGNRTQVEWDFQMPGSSDFEGRQHRTIPDPVAIDLGFCGKSRVKAWRDVAASHDANGWRKNSIQRTLPGRRSGRIWEVSVCTLPKRVDAGVSPARTMNTDLLSNYSSERIFEMLLNRVTMDLALPTREWPAVIRNRQLQSDWHYSARRSFEGRFPDVACNRSM